MDKNTGVSQGPRVTQISAWPCRLATWRAIKVISILMTGLNCGCARVGLHDQRLVSKRSMIFEDSPALVGRPTMTIQVEPGSAFSGGAQAGGCTSCK